MKHAHKSMCKNISEHSLALAFIGAIILVILFFVAIVSYNGYSMTGQNLSELGVGSTAVLFNSALITFAILAIPFFAFRIKGTSFLNQTACFLAIASMVFLAGVGAYPLNYQNEHFFSAAMFFFAAAIAAIAFSLNELKGIFRSKAKKSENLSKFGLVGFIIFGFLTAAVTFYYLLAFRNPVGQKLAVAFIFVWVILKLVLEKKRK